MNILIVSTRGDLHANVINGHLNRRPGVSSCILATDYLHDGFVSNWRCDAPQAGRVLIGDKSCSVNDFDLIWWRRIARQQAIDRGHDKASEALIDADCSGSLLGMLETAFEGRWISKPGLTHRASNKMVQLAAARSVGFRIPDTLVTQDASAVREFCDRHHRSGVIIKPLVGTRERMLPTTRIIASDVIDASVRVSPAIYQECIPGRQHIRMNLFGDCAVAALLESEHLDWRPDLNIPVRAWECPADLVDRASDLLGQLDLEMGVFDLKIDDEGDPIFLEVNPQGQFLFIEGLTGTAMAELFTDYLIGAASDGATRLIA